MPISLAKIFGDGIAMSDADVARWLRENYKKSVAEDDRRKLARDRHALYHDGGNDQIVDQLETVFDNDVVKELRKRFVKMAKFNNVTKRVVNELSTVYAKPAVRKVSQGDDKYQALLSEIGMGPLSLRINRYLNLHRQVWLGFRVIDEDDAPSGVRLDVVTPDNFYAVAHPKEPTKLVAIILDCADKTLRAGDTTPAFIVWTKEEFFYLDSEFRLATDGSEERNLLPIETNELGRLPGILASIEPVTDGLVDYTEGEDLKAAHLAVWFENILMLKESKSLNKQIALQGDLTSTPVGQASDSDLDLVLGDGVGVQSIDRGVDLAAYRETADYALERAAANYGIPPSVLRHEGATSGFEIELRRLGIRERRMQQEPTFRKIEKELAELMSAILAAEWQERSFSTKGWSIDFSQTQTPMEPSAEVALFKSEREAGLTNTVEFLMRRNPDLDERGALEEMTGNIAVEILRVMLMRALQAQNAGMNEGPDSATPEENGEDNFQRRGAQPTAQATAAQPDEETQ